MKLLESQRAKKRVEREAFKHELKVRAERLNVAAQELLDLVEQREQQLDLDLEEEDGDPDRPE